MDSIDAHDDNIDLSDNYNNEEDPYDGPAVDKRNQKFKSRIAG